MSLKQQFSFAMKNPGYTLRRLNSRTREYYLDILDTVTNAQNHEKVSTDKEFLILGLRRCGNHGIIKWVENQCRGKGFFLNNLRIGENPYQYLYEMVAGDVHSRDKFFVDELLRQPYFQGDEGILRLKDELDRKFAWKDYLIHSYEDHSVKNLADSMKPRRRNRYFGSCKTQYNILILRDPFNLMASRIHSGRFDVQGWRNQAVLSVWLEHAKEYVGETNFFNNKVLINFNLWSMDREYRYRLAEELGLDFTDKGINSVSEFGGGSSFDSQKFDGNAQKMDVTSRWKRFADDPNFKVLFERSEIFDYASKIFGEIEGIEVLRTV